MENKILLVDEVAELLRVSQSTINRWGEESRKGNGSFPLPISARGGKRRWSRDSIEAFIDSQTAATSSVPARKQRRSAKAFQARQERTDKALERYRTKEEADHCRA